MPRILPSGSHRPATPAALPLASQLHVCAQQKARGQGLNVAGQAVHSETPPQYSEHMGYLDQIFSEKGGLKKFLRDLFEKRLFKPFQTQDFHHDLELYFNHTLDLEFNKYIYGTGGVLEKNDQTGGNGGHNPYHPRLTKAQRQALL